MAEVSVKVNNKPYMIGCADGQEEHLIKLARIFDEHVEMVVSDVGAIGELRLFLMASLLMADELQELKAQLDESQSNSKRMNAGAFEIERRAAFALSDVAERIEKLSVED